MLNNGKEKLSFSNQIKWFSTEREKKNGTEDFEQSSKMYVAVLEENKDLRVGLNAELSEWLGAE